jgi:hypothetical protein
MAFAWLITKTDNAITVMVLGNIGLFFTLSFNSRSCDAVYEETLH